MELLGAFGSIVAVLVSWTFLPGTGSFVYSCEVCDTDASQTHEVQIEGLVP